MNESKHDTDPYKDLFQGLQEEAIAPPEESWDKVGAVLKSSPKATYIRRLKRWLLAALLINVTTIGCWWYFSGTSEAPSPISSAPRENSQSGKKEMSPAGANHESEAQHIKLQEEVSSPSKAVPANPTVSEEDASKILPKNAVPEVIETPKPVEEAPTKETREVLQEEQEQISFPTASTSENASDNEVTKKLPEESSDPYEEFLKQGEKRDSAKKIFLPGN